MQNIRIVDSFHGEELNNILHSSQTHFSQRELNEATKLPWTIAKDTERFLPVERFWIIKGDHPCIVRIKFNEYLDNISVEIAAPDGSRTEAIQAKISAQSVEESICRNEAISLTYASGTKDEYGDVEKADQLRVSFKVAPSVSEYSLPVAPLV